jgi:hypothetical protein
VITRALFCITGMYTLRKQPATLGVQNTKMLRLGIKIGTNTKKIT